MIFFFFITATTSISKKKECFYPTTFCNEDWCWNSDQRVEWNKKTLKNIYIRIQELKTLFPNNTYNMEKKNYMNQICPSSSQSPNTFEPLNKRYNLPNSLNYEKKKKTWKYFIFFLFCTHWEENNFPNADALPFLPIPLPRLNSKTFCHSFCFFFLLNN